MNHSDLNIISYDMYDRMGCALCGIENVFPELSDPNSKGGFGRGGDLETIIQIVSDTLKMLV